MEQHADSLWEQGLLTIFPLSTNLHVIKAGFSQKPNLSPLTQDFGQISLDTSYDSVEPMAALGPKAHKNIRSRQTALLT